MTTEVNQENLSQDTQSIEEKVVNNVLAISYDGPSVHVQIRSDLTLWEALGLLKTAEQIVMSKYNATLASE